MSSNISIVSRINKLSNGSLIAMGSDSQIVPSSRFFNEQVSTERYLNKEDGRFFFLTEMPSLCLFYQYRVNRSVRKIVQPSSFRMSLWADQSGVLREDRWRRQKWKTDQLFLTDPFEYGAAGRNRTHDPLVRSQVLYPAELQPRRKTLYIIFRK